MYTHTYIFHVYIASRGVTNCCNQGSCSTSPGQLNNAITPNTAGLSRPTHSIRQGLRHPACCWVWGGPSVPRWWGHPADGDTQLMGTPSQWGHPAIPWHSHPVPCAWGPCHGKKQSGFPSVLPAQLVLPLDLGAWAFPSRFPSLGPAGRVQGPRARPWVPTRARVRYRSST